MARFDQLEHKLESFIDRVIDEVNNGNKPKDLPLNELFSIFCTLKAWDKQHPSATVYKGSFGLFLKSMGKKYPGVKSLRGLTPMMISEYVRYLKDKRIFSKRRNQWESLSERTRNEYIKKLRHALEIVDSRGTQGLRERLITIKRPRTKKEIYIPSDGELAKIPEMLKMLRESDSEENKYLAFLVATVVQFCGRTRALSRLRFDMIEGLDSDEPIVKYIGKHRVEQIKGITNDWYKDFLRGWKQFVQQKYGNTPYFFPTERNGEITHIEDDWLRMKFKAFMRMCGLPQLTIHSFRYIYATRLYLMGVTPDAIKDILGVDKKTLKYYVKAAEERKKKALFKYMEKVSALPKEKEK